jgi:hypothetical protein
MIKEGPGHHPHSLKDPALIAGWVEDNMKPDSGVAPVAPAIAALTAPPTTGLTTPTTGLTFEKSYYYSYANSYRLIQPENTYATCRGPLFTDCYERYDVKTSSTWGITGMTIILPKKAAPGHPWIFRADRIGREAEPVDLALLAKGFTIVAAPVTEQAGPLRKQWDEVYQLLTSQGYSSRPAMEGTGAGGGEAYYWAIGHPNEVSCIYVLNPVLRSLQAAGPLTDSLAGLAKAAIPILHVCGSLDPWYAVNTVVTKAKYRQLGGHMKVMVKEGAGHFDALPPDPAPIVDFIVAAQQAAPTQHPAGIRP